MEDKEIYDDEFKAMVKAANQEAFSPYANFMFTHSGYEFYKDGVKIQKWEAFHMDINKLERKQKR